MMKNLQIIPFILLMLFYFILPQNAEAQFFKKLKKHVEKSRIRDGETHKQKG